MKKFIKLFTITGLYVFLILSLNGCKQSKNQQSPLSEKKLILGFSQIGNESSWRMCNTKSIINAAENNNIQIVVDDAHQKQENQLKAIRSFIVYQVDVIAFVPIVEDGWDSVLNEAKDAGIPVIIVDRKIKTKDKSLYAGYIGEDGIEEGRKAGNFLLEKFADAKKNLNIVEISGTENSSVKKERAAGFREVINKDKKFSIIYSESGDFLRSRGKEIIGQIIAYNNSQLRIGNKKIDIIYSHNDGMTLGVLDALDYYNLNPGTDVTIVTIDGEQMAIHALEKGRVNCVVECNPFIGEELMRLVKTVSNNESIPKETYLDEGIFTDTSDFDSIGQRGY